MTFVMGICAVYFGFCRTAADEQISNAQTSVQTKQAFQISEIYKQKPISAPPRQSYQIFFDEDIVPKLEALVKYRQKTGKQTFFVFKESRSVLAYWQADNAIYQLIVIENENIDWYYDKARIDLKTEVVPTGKYGNLGCCLYEKDWVEATIKKCKKGQKIIINP
jgi:hypothetical protein